MIRIVMGVEQRLCLHFSPWFTNSLHLIFPAICMLIHATSFFLCHQVFEITSKV